MHAFYNHRSKLKYRDEVVGRVGSEKLRCGTALMLPVVAFISVRKVGRVGRVKSVTLRCDTIAAAICRTFHCGELFKGLEGLEVLEELEG